MSGGGNDSRSGTSRQELNCETISFSTNLESVQANALKQVKVKQKLPLSVDRGKIIVMTADSSDIVGTITWTHASRLVECIDDGYEYVAIVRSKDDGLVKVSIQMSEKP